MLTTTHAPYHSPYWVTYIKGAFFFFQHVVSTMNRFQCHTIQAAEMRRTVTLDEELLKEAEDLTGITERSRLIRDGLEALIQRETAQRLARLGGTAPDVQISRRRPRATSQ